MKTLLKIGALAFLIIGSTSTSYALQLIHVVYKEKEAEELGVKITSEVVGTNLIGVRLEFSRRGELEHFHHGELEVASNGRRLVCATLLPLEQTKDKIVLYFSADPENVKMSTLTVIVSRASGAEPDGYSFAIKNFVRTK
jgi:hypothetical protein